MSDLSCYINPLHLLFFGKRVQSFSVNYSPVAEPFIFSCLIERRSCNLVLFGGSCEV